MVKKRDGPLWAVNIKRSIEVKEGSHFGNTDHQKRRVQLQ